MPKSSVFLLTALLAGCNSTKLIIAPASDLTPMGDGEAMVVEQSFQVGVELLTPQFSGRVEEVPTFAVYLENKSESSVLLSTSTIKLYSGETLIEILSPEEFIAEAHEVMQRKAEGYSGQQAEVIFQSGAGVNEKVRDNSAMIAKLSSAKMANRAAASRNTRHSIKDEVEKLITVHQINPGKSFTGLIKFHPKGIEAGLPLKMVVTLDGEIYQFDFLVSEESN